MMSLGRSLGLALCLWGVAVSAVPRTAGPCFLSAKQLSFNCSARKLTEVPVEVWANVTLLDLSQNSLNLTHPATLRALGKLEHLVLLNLSGSYLPLLDGETLAGLQFLRVLDLSACQLTEIKPGAFRAFPELHTLKLGDNRLRGPLPAALRDLRVLSILDLHGNSHLRADPPAWLKGVRQVIWPGDQRGSDLGDTFQGAPSFLRKLLVEEHNENKSTKGPGPSKGVPAESHTWIYLIAALVTAICISGLLVLAVKCKMFRRYIASYRHSLLYEGDATSQCSRAGLEVGHPDDGPNHPRGLDDDDGFIEDNYIQASERDRAEREAKEEEEEDSDDDLQFTIG